MGAAGRPGCGAWHVLGWIWSTFLVAGVLVSLLMSYVTTGRLDDPRTWVVIGFLRGHAVAAALGMAAAILLSIGAYLAHRTQQRWGRQHEQTYQQSLVMLGRGVHHLLEEAHKKPAIGVTPPPPIRTPDQVRVFISSTLEELAPERRAARGAIAQLHLTPVFFESRGTALPAPRAVSGLPGAE